MSLERRWTSASSAESDEVRARERAAEVECLSGRSGGSAMRRHGRRETPSDDVLDEGMNDSKHSRQGAIIKLDLDDVVRNRDSGSTVVRARGMLVDSEFSLELVCHDFREVEPLGRSDVDDAFVRDLRDGTRCGDAHG